MGPKGEQQRLVIVDRTADGRLQTTDAGGVIFVPLTDISAQTAPGNSTKVNVMQMLARSKGLP